MVTASFIWLSLELLEVVGLSIKLTTWFFPWNRCDDVVPLRLWLESICLKVKGESKLEILLIPSESFGSIFWFLRWSASKKEKTQKGTGREMLQVVFIPFVCEFGLLFNYSESIKWRESAFSGQSRIMDWVNPVSEETRKNWLKLFEMIQSSSWFVSAKIASETKLVRVGLSYEEACMGKKAWSEKDHQ